MPTSSTSGEHQVNNPRYDDPEAITQRLSDPMHLWQIAIDRAAVASKVKLRNLCAHGNILLMSDGSVLKFKPSTYPRRDMINTVIEFRDRAHLSDMLGFIITDNMLEESTPRECNNPTTPVAA